MSDNPQTASVRYQDFLDAVISPADDVHFLELQIIINRNECSDSLQA